jgi:hypothetical protein
MCRNVAANSAMYAADQGIVVGEDYESSPFQHAAKMSYRHGNRQ